MTLFELKKNAVQKLRETKTQTPELDADCLLQFVLNKDKTFILMNRNLELSPETENKFNKLLEKRQRGLPVAYITGKKEFFALDFFVTEDVLIPKPDTEILVEQALEKISLSKKNKISIADVCTGSGCVGISIANSLLLNKVEFNLTLTDISEKALSIAKKNAESILPETKIDFINGDLLCGLSSLDFVVSNPPYVPHQEVEELLLDGRNEPRLALDGDVDSAQNEKSISSYDGLKIIKRLVPMVYKALNKNGYFLMESGEYQTERVKELFIDAGFTEVETVKDLSGEPRVTIGKKID